MTDEKTFVSAAQQTQSLFKNPGTRKINIHINICLFSQTIQSPITSMSR